MNLYGKYEALSPIYSGGLTNHLPMMMRALQNMNVDEEIIESLLDNYQDEKAIFDLTQNSVPKGEFEEEYIVLTSHYLHELNDNGIKSTVREFMGRFKNVVPSGLFHGVIRLMYAVDSEELIQVAQALAYFDLSSTEYHFKSTQVASKDLYKKITEFREGLIIENFTLNTSKFTSRINELVDDNKDRIEIYTSKEIREEDILKMILLKYKETKDFYVLHLITGFHAIVYLKEYFDDYEYILNQFICIAQLVMMFDLTRENYKAKQELTFKEIIKHVPKLQEAHDIKLIYSLKELYDYYKQENLLQIANMIIEKAL